VLRLGLAAVILVSATLLLSGAAQGASACATAVLRDWSDDGRVAPKYSLPCYEDAIAALPADIRDYTNAEDVITRALSSAVRARGTSQRLVDGEQDDPTASAPLFVVGLGSVALAVLAAGALSYAARQRRVHSRG
jgi:hypothetical protein